MRYSILDPTGNITALVESAVPVDAQPSVAAQIMARHSEVEQVGFVSYAPSMRAGQTVQASLRMAGGEFCGNATMCAAYLYALRADQSAKTVWLEVSGSGEPVRVDLLAHEPHGCEASIQMPEAIGMSLERLAWEGVVDDVPVVYMAGISHAILESVSPLYGLLHRPLDAERAVRDWCAQLGSEGLGLMFLEGEDTAHKNLVPLVHIPGSDTVYWEHSCASGSAAVGMYAMARTNARVDMALQEPGGTLRVEGDATGRRVTLHGHVRFLSSEG